MQLTEISAVQFVVQILQEIKLQGETNLDDGRNSNTFKET